MFLILLVIGWVAGIGLEPMISQAWWRWLLLAGISGGVLWWVRSDWQLRLVGAVLLGFALGSLRAEVATPNFQDPAFTAAYNDRKDSETDEFYTVIIEGTVVAEPDNRDFYTNLRVLPDTLYITETKELVTIRDGLVLARADLRPSILFGDRVRLRGRLTTPPQVGDFDYTMYLAQQHVHSQISGRAISLESAAESFPPFRSLMEEFSTCPVRIPSYHRLQCAAHILQRYLFLVKAPLLTSVVRTLNEPQAAYLQAILLGVRANLPDTLQTAFRLTGTVHMVSISGFHVSIIAGILLWLLRGVLGVNLARPVAVVAILLYVLLVGAPPPAIRAGIMASALLFSMGGANTLRSLQVLALAVGGMTLYDPAYVGMIGFQLSAVSMVGLILYATPIANWIGKALRRVLPESIAAPTHQWVGGVVAMTLAAQIATLPLSMYYFGQVSLSNTFANILIAPAQPPALLLGAISTIAGALSLPIGEWLAWGSWLFLAYTLQMVTWIAKIPFSALYLGQPTWQMLIIYYGVILMATALHKRLPEEQPRWWRVLGRIWPLVVGWGVLIAVCYLYIFAHRPDGKLHVTFLDVGQGSSTLIETPKGEYILIDGGASPSRLAQQLGARIPFGTRNIARVIATSPAETELTGLSGVLLRYHVEHAYYTFDPANLEFPSDRTYADWAEQLSVEKIPNETIGTAQEITTDDGVQLTVIPLSATESAIRVQYEETSYLLLAGISATTLAENGGLLAGGASVVLVPRSAAPESITESTWAALDPQIAVISVGAGSPPASDILRLFENTTTAILRTDLQGRIDVSTDGAVLWSEKER